MPTDANARRNRPASSRNNQIPIRVGASCPMEFKLRGTGANLENIPGISLCPCRTKVMRIVHKCRRQGSGSASPKGRARALAPSQSYRFVNNSHDLPTDGRRPQISPEISSCLCKVGRAKSPQSSGRNSGEAAGEIILCLELAQAEFITEQRSPAASWLDLKQLTEPHEFILASSPLQDREKP